MAAQTQFVRPENGSLLRNTLRANSLFSAASGLLFMIGAGGIAAFLGVPDASLIILLIGVGLLGFAAFVGYVSRREPLDPRLGWLIFALDVVWVVGSYIILAVNAFDLSTEGRWAILIIAEVVAVFAALEYVGSRRLR